METLKRGNRCGVGYGYNRRRLAPMVEVMERKELLDAGVGTIAGTVFFDSNGSGTIDAADAYLPGATVQLYKAGEATPIASMTTDSKGGFAFENLAAGDYVVTETPPAGKKLVGNRLLSDLYQANAAADRSILVTVPDSQQVFANFNGVDPTRFVASSNVLNGSPMPGSEGALKVTLGTAPGKTDLNAGYLTYCLDDLTTLPFEGGTTFQVVPVSISKLTNGTSATPISADHSGRIAYLYNHFGNSSLTNIQAAGLQLAIWELIYDQGATPDFSSGNFQVGAAISPSTDAEVAAAVAQATSYWNDSVGKSEAALLLHAKDMVGAPIPGMDGYQSLIAKGSFDFLNADSPPPPVDPLSSISGRTYCDANDDGVKQASEPGIPGVTIVLTGVDKSGNTVRAVTTTDTNGFYQFKNLKAGTYTITEVQPAGYIDGKDTQGTPGTGVTRNDQFKNIVLPAGFHGVNNNFGERLAAPTVTDLKLIGIHQQDSKIILSFKGALDPAQASNPANYTLIALGKDDRFGTRDDRRVLIKSAVYDQKTDTVTLTPAQHLNVHYHYALSLNVPAASDCAGPARYTTVFGRTSVPYFTHHDGSKYPNPPMTRHQLARHARVIRQAEAAIARKGGLI